MGINKLFLVKIPSSVVVGEEWYEMQEEIVKESLLRGHEYKITIVQKKTKFKFAWIVASSPEQAKKIADSKVSLNDKISGRIFSQTRKTHTNDIAKRNALILIARNLNEIKSSEAIEAALKEYMGEENVGNIYFKEENGKHMGSCNV